MEHQLVVNRYNPYNRASNLYLFLLIGSPWRDRISNAILRLQEDGKLQSLHTKWWKEAKGALVCEMADDKKKDSANELGLANVGGVFVVLVVGLCLSFLVAMLEFIWKARQSADRTVKTNSNYYLIDETLLYVKYSIYQGYS